MQKDPGFMERMCALPCVSSTHFVPIPRTNPGFMERMCTLPCVELNLCCVHPMHTVPCFMEHMCKLIPPRPTFILVLLHRHVRFITSDTLQVIIHLHGPMRQKVSGSRHPVSVTITGLVQQPQQKGGEGQGGKGGRIRVSESWVLPPSMLGKTHSAAMVKAEGDLGQIEHVELSNEQAALPPFELQMLEVVNMQTGQHFLFPARGTKGKTTTEDGQAGSSSLILPVTHDAFIKVTTLTGGKDAIGIFI
eukprot:261117-Pelagomonas_calceolata.AAC.5